MDKDNIIDDTAYVKLSMICLGKIADIMLADDDVVDERRLSMIRDTLLLWSLVSFNKKESESNER